MADKGRILGPDGRPARLSEARLRRRTTVPTLLTGRRAAWQWFSVVTGLTPDRLRQIYAAVAGGMWCPDYFELATEIEERDAHYAAVLQQRILAAAGESLEVAPADDSATARRAADLVRTHLVEGPGWHGLVVDLLDAAPKGVALVEVVWRRVDGAARWAPAAYHRVDPRWVVMAADTETPWLLADHWGAASRPPGLAARMAVEPLEPGKHLWHVHRVRAGQPLRGGLAFTAASYWLLKSLAVRDWWSYAETYGLPFRIGKYSPQTATIGDIQTLIDAVSTLAAEAGAVIPDTMSVELVAAAASGRGSEGLHAAMAKWCDQQVSQLVVGQTMTSEDGSSRAQAEVHDEVRGDLTRDDARQIAETLTRLADWFCALNGIRERAWPRVALPPVQEAVDVAAVMEAVGGGLRVPAAWLRRRMGIPDPAPDDELVAAPLAAPPGEGDDPPPPRRDRALHAAEAAGPSGATAAEAMTAPLVAALDAAAAPDDLVEAAATEAPEAWIERLALATFRARAAAEIEAGAEEPDVEENTVRPSSPMPAAARRFLAGKGRTVSRHWTDVWREEHAGAFTAAWLDRDDLVAAVHQSLTRALARGETMESFRAGIGPWLQRAGWAPPARGGSVPRRLARIYRINTRVAFAAGRWEGAVAADRRSPGRWLLHYGLGPSRDHRETHAAWARRPTLLPVSDPWWRTHYPPNGWGCQCRARLVPAAEADRLGAPADAPPVELVDQTVDGVDALTGEVTSRRVRVPAGVDPGWDYNPGAHRLDGHNRAAAGHLDRVLQGRAPAGRPNAWADVAPAVRHALAVRRVEGHVAGDAFDVLRRPRAGADATAPEVLSPVAVARRGQLDVAAEAGELVLAPATVVREAGDLDWSASAGALAGAAPAGDGRWVAGALEIARRDGRLVVTGVRR